MTWNFFWIILYILSIYLQIVWSSSFTVFVLSAQVYWNRGGGCQYGKMSNFENVFSPEITYHKIFEWVHFGGCSSNVEIGMA